MWISRSFFTICYVSVLTHLLACFQQRIYEYRDRAAERRNFHGGFGVGPGQKSTLVDDVCSPVSTEEAAAEALDMSFGSGSYARKMLEKMGWKEVNFTDKPVP